VISDVFIEVFTEKVDNILGEYEPYNPDSLEVNDIPRLIESEVKLAMARLRNKKSCGIDTISDFFIKKFQTVLVPYLTIQQNSS